MTPHDSSDSQPSAAQHAVMEERPPGVFRTARDEPARRRQQRPDQQLIPPHEQRRQSPRAHRRGVVPRGARARASASRRISSTSSGNGRVLALGRATTTSATSSAIWARTRRYASRIRRRARLRATAPRICRLTAKPTRRPSARCQSAMKLGRSCRLPCWKTAWNSAARRRRSPRGSGKAAWAVGTALC